jgi:hypothetical protein
MDDSRSATLHEEKQSSPPSRDEEKSAVASLREKEAEMEVPVVTEHYQKELDASEENRNELKQVKTSETGQVYPTGVKLGLITLALCLSVFLMALVS